MSYAFRDRGGPLLFGVDWSGQTLLSKNASIVLSGRGSEVGQCGEKPEGGKRKQNGRSGISNSLYEVSMIVGSVGSSQLPLFKYPDIYVGFTLRELSLPPHTGSINR